MIVQKKVKIMQSKKGGMALILNFYIKKEKRALDKITKKVVEQILSVFLNFICKNQNKKA